MKRRVLFYSDSATFGGHERETVELIEALRHNGWYDLVLLYHHEAFDREVGPGVIRRRLRYPSPTPLPGLRSLNLLAIREVRQRLWEFEPDLVVVSQGNIELGVRGLLANGRTAAPTVSYIPFGLTLRETGSRLGAFRDLVNRSLYRLPDAFITVAEYQARLLRRHTGSPVSVLLTPVEDQAGAVQTALPIDGLDGELSVGVIGRVYFRHKNQNVLVHVATELGGGDECLDATFHVVGDGPDLGRLEGLVRAAGLEDRFRFHGWIPRARLPAFVAEHIDLVLIPSWHEGVPLIMLEAAAFGKPFLISDLPFVSDYGIPPEQIIDPEDPGDIAGKLRRLARRFDPSTYAQVRRRILALHSPDRFRRQTASTFRELLGGV